jgi:tRNA A-37 threonylcarbamoyl transferase component Bud32/tetratricopeptide (TPR) repeat protein
MADESKMPPDQKLLLDEILTRILREKDAGREPNLAAWKARYPDFAEQLTTFFADQEGAEEVFGAIGGGTYGSGCVIPPAPAGTVEECASGNLGTCGDCELLTVIGSGGMGVVYKARQRGLDRVVALKKIRSSRQPSQEEVFRFQEEARAAARLQHDNIVRVYGYGREGPDNYYIMELITGETLAKRAAHYSGKPEAVVQLMSKVALAVQHAHSRGVLHRDLKPSNILLDSDKGMPHVADFGLAGILDDSGRLVDRSCGAVGTLRYMAPEQALKPESVTVAADIFSVGVMMFELLTGHHPFPDPRQFDPNTQSSNTLRLTLPRQLTPTLSRDLEAVCLKCLMPDPEQRYSSAQALADDLACLERGIPVGARRPWFGERAMRWFHRNIHYAVPSTLVALIILIGLLWYLHDLSRERDRALDKERITANSRERIVNILSTLQGIVREERGGAAAALATLSQDLPSDPVVRFKIAQTWNAAGDLYRLRRQFDRALKAHGEAERLFRQLRNDYPDVKEYRAEQGAALQNLGLTHSEAGDWADAEQCFVRSQKILEELVNDHPDCVLALQYLTHCQGNSAFHHQKRGHIDKAMALYKDVAVKLARISKPQPEDKRRAATSLNNLADIYIFT